MSDLNLGLLSEEINVLNDEIKNMQSSLEVKKNVYDLFFLIDFLKGLTDENDVLKIDLYHDSEYNVFEIDEVIKVTRTVVDGKCITKTTRINKDIFVDAELECFSECINMKDLMINKKIIFTNNKEGIDSFISRGLTKEGSVYYNELILNKNINNNNKKSNFKI